ncbi:zinc finger CCHC domain protein [Parasponia andersonii]|uniref:Zinc finger CCHC domain protein n=1 Tax=Parasponia andersonii TaxID=3476 RepID=A0A2P5DAR5_PARAD|nr:zinc finger CCHC domain protein [Parasponia andersonii]
MAETPLKRQREETQIENIGEEDCYKRQKSFSDILSLLDEEEEEPNQDLSSLMTTLQQELSSESGSDPNSFGTGETDPENPTTASSAAVEDYTWASYSNSPLVSKEDEPEEEEEKGRVMRHLLEASDDELGIPNVEAGSGREIGFNGGDSGFSVSEGLWELEDEAANYYALLQSELFM